MLIDTETVRVRRSNEEQWRGILDRAVPIRTPKWLLLQAAIKRVNRDFLGGIVPDNLAEGITDLFEHAETSGPYTMVRLHVAFTFPHAGEDPRRFSGVGFSKQNPSDQRDPSVGATVAYYRALREVVFAVARHLESARQITKALAGQSRAALAATVEEYSIKC